MRGGAGGAAGREGKYGKPPLVCSCDGCPYGKGDSLSAGSESRKDTLLNTTTAVCHYIQDQLIMFSSQ
jgi:hypothetical protein